MGQGDEGFFGLLPLIIVFAAQAYVVFKVCQSSATMPIKVCWTLVVLLFPFVGVCAWACCGPYDTGGGRIQHSLSQRYGRPGPESGPFAVSRPQPQTQPPDFYANTYGPHRPGQEHAGSGYDEEYGRQPAYAPEGEPPVVVAEEFKQPERYAHSYGKQPPMAVAHRIE